MKCVNIQKAVVAYEDSSLPPDIQEHIKGCAACREFVAQNDKVKALIALKRFEQPDEAFSTRNLKAIRYRLAEESQKATDAVGWGVLWPVARYAAAMVLIALAAIYVLVEAPIPALQSETPEAQQPLRIATDTPAAPAANPTNLSVPIRVASNGTPRGVQYGTTPSVLVDFEY